MSELVDHPDRRIEDAVEKINMDDTVGAFIKTSLLGISKQLNIVRYNLERLNGDETDHERRNRGSDQDQFSTGGTTDEK